MDHARTPTAALHLSRMARRFTERVVLYTNGADELAAQLKKELEKDKGGRSGLVTVNSRRIERLRRGPGRESEVVVTLEGGSEVTEGFLVSCKTTPLHVSIDPCNHSLSHIEIILVILLLKIYIGTSAT